MRAGIRKATIGHAGRIADAIRTNLRADDPRWATVQVGYIPQILAAVQQRTGEAAIADIIPACCVLAELQGSAVTGQGGLRNDQTYDITLVIVAPWDELQADAWAEAMRWGEIAGDTFHLHQKLTEDGILITAQTVADDRDVVRIALAELTAGPAGLTVHPGLRCAIMDVRGRVYINGAPPLVPHK